jgi:hypothetical protein
VALSRAKKKLILVASRSIFSLFSPDEETFANSLLWKNLLVRTCSTLVWDGERGGKRLAVWGASDGTVRDQRTASSIGAHLVVPDIKPRLSPKG